MARITVEDCMDHVPNRFHLVRMASIRAKQLKKGALPLLKSEENKVVVMSLREIAAGLVKPGDTSPPAAAPEAVPAATEALVQAEAPAATEAPAPTAEEAAPSTSTDPK